MNSKETARDFLFHFCGVEPQVEAVERLAVLLAEVHQAGFNEGYNYANPGE